MVKEEFLKQYGILEPDIPNKWNYTLEQPGKKTTAGETTPGHRELKLDGAKGDFADPL